jgi:hypothetical protein
MVSLSFKTLSLGLLSLCSCYPAIPVTQERRFTLSLRAPTYPSLPLIAIPYADSPTSFALIFEPFTTLPGTPASIDNTYLDFHIGETTYSMHYGDPGEVHGLALMVTAAKGHVSGTPGMRAGSGDLGPPMTSGAQSFFACNTTIDEIPRLALHFGVFNRNGTAPHDCVIAQLQQNFYGPE